MLLLADDVMLGITGGRNPGYQPRNNALGRVGPGARWKFLGNYYTPEALDHDNEVRSRLANGENELEAQLHSLDRLPAAAASYVRARWFPGPNDMHLA